MQLDHNPAAIYVASLAHGARRTTGDALNIIATLLTNGNPERQWKGGTLTVEWSVLRFQHTEPIRSKLAQDYSAATANKPLSALRCVLNAVWRLGLMTADDYNRAADIPSITGSTLPRGRAPTAGEIG